MAHRILPVSRHISPCTVNRPVTALAPHRRRAWHGRILYVVPAAFLVAVVSLSPAAAQEAPPDLKGVWSGTARSVVWGSGYHHPGAETDKDPPRIREVRFTYTVKGQDNRLVWGTFSSPFYEEPFVWTISQDNKTLLGADTDGQHRLTILGPDRMEQCYTHTALSPTKSIVASCFPIERTAR